MTTRRNGGPVATRSILREGTAEAVVDATPAQVYGVLTDVTRVGEWSHECRTAAWVGHAPEGDLVGARFRGRNRVGLARWGRLCTVVDAVPPRLFTYRTGGSWVGDSTEWTFELKPEEAGTRIVQSYKVLSLPRWAEMAICAVVPQHQDRREALEDDLVRLGQVAGTESV